MTQLQFADAMVSRGCIGSDNIFCGTYSNIPFSVAFLKGASGKKTSFSLTIQLNRNPSGKLYRTIMKQLSPTRSNRNKSNLANTFSLLITTKSDIELESAMDNALALFAANFGQYKLIIPTICPICKKTDVDSYAFYGGTYRTAHAACVQNAAMKQQESTQNNLKNGSYVTGAIGALLGAVVGALPNILLISFLNVISAWLCALIPLCAYLGYKLLAGKMTRLSILFVLVSSVIMVPIYQYADTAILLYISEKYFLSPAEFIAAFRMYPSDFMPGLLQVLLFVGIGFFIVLGITTRTGIQEVQSTNFSAVTLRPINNGSAPQVATATQPLASAPPSYDDPELNE